MAPRLTAPLAHHATMNAHRFARLLGLSLLAAVPAAIPVAAAPAAPRAAQDDEGKVAPIELAELSFTDALSRAERLEKMILIVWYDGEDSLESRWLKGILQDEGVRAWVQENAIAVKIDANAKAKDARRNQVGTQNLPVLDLFDARRGGRLERLMRGSNAIDLLAAVYGLGDESKTLEKPVVGEDTEPFRWLAWSNARFRQVDDTSGKDAVFGYSWCLHLADDYRPGFRARYLEFLLRRVAECKIRAMEAVTVFEQERTKLGDRMRQGVATRRDVYELTRVDFWYRKEVLTRDLFLELGGRGTEQDQYRKWLLSDVIAILGRSELYDPILETIEHDPVEVFRRRIAEMMQGVEDPNAADKAASATEGSATEGSATEGSGDGSKANDSDEAVSPVAELFDPATFDPPLAKPLTFAILDTRQDIIHDASWVFEALLSAGRGADAKALRDFIFTVYPLNRSYGLFFERALRLELHGLAAEIADLGIATLDERGQRRMQRLLNKIPKDTTGSGK